MWGVPDVLPGNVEAVKVWAECRTQVIAGIGGVIDIDIMTVKMVMDLFGVKNQKACLEKVRLMFDEYKDAMKEKEGAKSKN